jgi:hypothetical protein
VKEGSRNGASLSAGALLGKSGGGAPLLGIWKDMGRRVQRTGISQSRNSLKIAHTLVEGNGSLSIFGHITVFTGIVISAAQRLIFHPHFWGRQSYSPLLS